jgi:hypothetical protein
LNLKFDVNYPDSSLLVFQTFPASLRRLRMEIASGEITASNSYLKGDFLLPVMSIENPLPFTVPITNLGFQDGYLEDLTGSKFVFNAGSGDQEIKLTIKRAVLSAYEKIAMTIDLEWPSLGITLSDLRGFNAWGDYSIGFDTKNGTVPLTQRYNASLSGYPITVGVIGAASNGGNYIFATTADAGLGDDVSGGESVPSINVYSITANKFVPADASGQTGVKTASQVPFDQAAASITQTYTQLQQTLQQKVAANQQQMVSETESLKNNLASSSSQAYSSDDMVQDDGESFPAELGQGITSDDRFNSNQQQIINEIIAGFVEEIAKPITQPIKAKSDSISVTIEKAVNGLVDSINVEVNKKIEAIIKALTDKLITSMQNAPGASSLDFAGPVRDMRDATIIRISQELNTALKKSSHDNIIVPVNTLLKDQIAGRINKYITTNGSQIIYAAISGGSGGTEEALKEMMDGAPAVLKAILKDVAAFVSIAHIKSTLAATAAGLVKNINVDDVAHDLRKTGEDILVKAGTEALNKELNKLANQYADDLGLGGFGLGGENPIDFVGVAQRFQKDGIKGVFAIDPVRVRLITPVIDLDGFMSYTPKHPIYGDVWLGDIDMTIKVPKKFKFNAIYFNGRKDDLSYWFCQITPPGSNNTAYELGKPLPKTARVLETPVEIGVAEIVAASGRLYHHMSENGTGIVPDAQMAYGAYMNFVFFDKSGSPGNAGKNLRLEVSGEINAKETGDYTIAFDGNLQLRNATPRALEIDPAAVVKGTVTIRYNSAEEHFFGYAKVVVESKQLCAQASLLVDVKPGHWRVAIGSRDERVIFVPGCAGWSPTGWLDLNESTATLGLGVQYSVQAGQDVDLGIITVGIEVDAGFAFGLEATVQYDPSFALMSAGVWVDIWAGVSAHYKTFGKSHSITLVDIYIRGDLMITFIPSPTTIEGKLNGTIQILSFGIHFNAGMKKQLG